MKINELLVESQIDEISLGGIASGIGRGLGTVRNAFSAGADGYADKRQEYLDQRAAQLAARAGKAPAGQDATAPTPALAGQNDPATTPAPAGQTPAPTTQTTGQTTPADDPAYKQALAAVDKLDPASKKQLAGDLQKSLASGGADATKTPDADKTPAPTEPAPNAEKPADTPTELPAGGKGTGQNFDTQTGKPISQYGQQQSTSTTPAPTTPPTTGGKMTPAQQAALKAKLQGQRQAGKTTATQTGSGFKNYVGGSQEKMAGVDASGAPVFKKLQRESVGFSNFLGMTI